MLLAVESTPNDDHDWGADVIRADRNAVIEECKAAVSSLPIYVLGDTTALVSHEQVLVSLDAPEGEAMRALPLPSPVRCERDDCKGVAHWFVEFKTDDGKEVGIRVCTACARRMGAKLPEEKR